ncbi:DNA polymerase alpha subunit B N-terminal-domain-containing protein [Lasiosphaeria ovina]|uniref:DNA polymerase alpha subunit B n=1 Tax=Lasiosphaeria ovina TaxID=92902 RepID=A0AAE0KDF0_9PEZI|nr:DNA polymerase alpha subunit B N-terminal-domain-containing protein [Lasiosphaeria ovina]
MADDIVVELNEHFGSADKELPADMLAELLSIMRLHELSAQDVFFKWESYCIKMDRDELEVSLSSLRAFKQDLQDALERTNRSQPHIKTEKRVAATPRSANKAGDVFGMLDALTTPGPGRSVKSAAARRRQHDTPAVSRLKAEPASSPLKLEDRLNAMGAIPSSSFADRQNPGEVVEILNDHLPAPEPPIAPFSESRVKLTAASDQKKLGYKPLAMKLSEASEILDDRIDDFMNWIMEHHKLDDSAFGSAVAQGTTEIVAVGRIASDSAEGMLNAASLVLEMSRRMGAGLRVPLKLDRLPGYQFFPGQIVAVRGVNTSGSDFTVHEVLSTPLLPNAASAPAVLEAHREKLRGSPDAMDADTEPMPLNIIFASGPYTADDNLDFEPLHAICNEAADTYADALVFTGPFIDSEHPLIASGDFDLPDEALYEPDAATMSTVFKYMISPALNRIVAANPHVTVLLVPSVRDVLDKHVSWPQDAFSRKELGLHKAVKIIGNPMTLSINETVVGISSQDALWELRHEELVGGKPADPSLLSRVSRYLIEQRHYFPLFPPADRQKLPKTGTADGVPPGAMLDVSYLKLGEMVNVRPDVLVVPSALPPFAKVVESVLVINPGYLSKRRGAGTYARMTLYPPKTSQAEVGSGGMMAHKVFERARVEITRI